MVKKAAQKTTRSKQAMRSLSLAALREYTPFLQDLQSRGHGYRSMIKALETEKQCTTSTQTMRTWLGKRRNPTASTLKAYGRSRQRQSSKQLSWTQSIQRTMERQREAAREDIVDIAMLSKFPPTKPFDLVMRYENWVKEQALIAAPLRQIHQPPPTERWNVHALLARSSFY